jgi:small-conductance mechanosensitive channel
MRTKSIMLLPVLLYLLFFPAGAFAANTGIKQDAPVVGTPVVFVDTLFYCYSPLGPFSPSERALAAETRLKALYRDPSFSPDSLKVIQGELTTDIFFGDRVIVSITPEDAKGYGKSQSLTASDYLKSIQTAIALERKTNSWRNISIQLLWALLVLGALVFVFVVINQFHRKSLPLLEKIKYKGIRIKDFQVISPEKQRSAFIMAAPLGKYLLQALIFFFSLPLIFSLIPWTHRLAMTLWNLILSPIKSIGAGLVNFIPNAITIIVIITVIRFAIKFLRKLAYGVEKGGLRIRTFHPDWAMSTFNIIRFILYVFMLIAIFPYLPGSDSPVFKGVSVFLGVLFSFGSSSAVSNIIAGLVITYMRPFQVGDRVKIGEAVGDVVSKTLLVTRIRTIKNEDVNIPNSTILTGQTVNYSSAVKRRGLILHTTVTIGYNAPWKTVHKLLIDAAGQTEGLLKDPAPFVLQTSLDDYYVSYQINAYTDQPQKMAGIYSELHQQIQDQFNQAGVEIMSPQYNAVRDGNHTTIPVSYLGKDYSAPAFSIDDARRKN